MSGKSSDFIKTSRVVVHSSTTAIISGGSDDRRLQIRVYVADVGSQGWKDIIRYFSTAVVRNLQIILKAESSAGLRLKNIQVNNI